MGALKRPQRVRAEHGRQTFMVILCCENTAARVFPSIAPIALGGLGERSSSPSGSGRSPVAKRFWPGHKNVLVHFKLKMKSLATMGLNKFSRPHPCSLFPFLPNLGRNGKGELLDGNMIDWPTDINCSGRNLYNRASIYIIS